MSDRLADAISIIVGKQAGVVLRFGVVATPTTVDVGAPEGTQVLMSVTHWAAGPAPAAGQRCALLIQRGSVLGVILQ